MLLLLRLLLLLLQQQVEQEAACLACSLSHCCLLLQSQCLQLLLSPAPSAAVPVQPQAWRYLCSSGTSLASACSCRSQLQQGQGMELLLK